MRPRFSTGGRMSEESQEFENQIRKENRDYKEESEDKWE